MNEIRRFRFARLLPAVSMVSVMVLAGCGGDIFDVKNPGAILDEDLNNPRGVSALVVGMSGDFSEGYDGQSFLNARGGDEMSGKRAMANAANAVFTSRGACVERFPRPQPSVFAEKPWDKTFLRWSWRAWSLGRHPNDVRDQSCESPDRELCK